MAREKDKRSRVIGYLRVSTNQQDLNNQRLELLDYTRRNNLKIDEFVEIEISSRKDTKARRIDELLEILHEGDMLFVSELSRLGRSVGQVIQIVDSLVKRQVQFVAIKENIVINGRHDIQTKVMTTLFGLFAEIERDLISERTKQGLAAARAKGRLLGRPKGPGKSKLDQYRPEIESLLKNGSSKTFVAQRYGTSLPNLYNWLAKHNINTTPSFKIAANG